MFVLSKKGLLTWTFAALSLALIVGCTASNSTPETQTSPPSSSSDTDAEKDLLINIQALASEGKVLGCDFPVKTTVMEDITKQWGEPDKIDWVAAAKGSFATYASRALVFGFNKGMQIFEVRSSDQQLQSLSLTKIKEVFGVPAYDTTANGEEIIGYTAGQEFKIEFVLPQPTSSNSNPSLDHYLVLYPQGTVNMMADDPGRQW